MTQYNVLAGMRRQKASRAERLDEEAQRGRALTDDQVGSLWASVTAMGTFGGLIRLALLTGMRRNELAGLRWLDVHDDRIVLAAQATKTGSRHEIPLTSAMRAVLTAQSRTTSDLVFPSSRTNARMRGWTSRVDGAVSASGSQIPSARFAPDRAHGHVSTWRRGRRRGAGDRACSARADRDLQQGSAWTARVDAFERVSDHVAGVVANADDAPASVISLPARART